MSVIHDHFDGSAHCVECAGRCRLTGTELALTQMVRYRLELSPWMNICERAVLAEMGVDPEKLIARAKATRP